VPLKKEFLTMSKLSLMILLVGVLVVYCFSVIDYMKCRSANETLTTQLSDSSQTLEKLPSPATDLQARLATTEAMLSAEQDAFPDEINSNKLINDILELADNFKVTAVPLQTYAWAIEKFGKNDYPVFTIDLQVRGDLGDALQFIEALENGEYETIVVKQTRVITLEDDEDKIIAGTNDGSLPVIISMSVSVYTQRTAS